ncbi:MAG: hypothetical protein SPI06_09060 [Terrisporobacter sp.]|uniref:hypothetical protein n=1 Tax=Terrisporobacter sp. TaxID=1965305 RepID=UPI002A90D9D7|nr:hypothetical protein [Terrisporobacter sp.]MDY6153551.1 hypothetical protein [Terrisporobacter sp.]
MKLFVSRKKYDLLNKEYLLLNDNYEELKNAYKEKNDRVLDLECKNEHSYFEKADLENEVEILNQEVKLYQNTVKDLEEEIDKLKKANKELAKLWNDANRKLWCNNESARQLRKLSENILDSQRIDKNQLASYIYDISMYVGGGVGVELKSKDK